MIRRSGSGVQLVRLAHDLLQRRCHTPCALRCRRKRRAPRPRCPCTPVPTASTTPAPSAPGRVRQRRFGRVVARAHVGVERVHAGGVHSHQHLTRGWTRDRASPRSSALLARQIHARRCFSRGHRSLKARPLGLATAWRPGNRGLWPGIRQPSRAGLHCRRARAGLTRTAARDGSAAARIATSEKTSDAASSVKGS